MVYSAKKKVGTSCRSAKTIGTTRTKLQSNLILYKAIISLSNICTASIHKPCVPITIQGPNACTFRQRETKDRGDRQHNGKFNGVQRVSHAISNYVRIRTEAGTEIAIENQLFSRSLFPIILERELYSKQILRIQPSFGVSSFFRPSGIFTRSRSLIDIGKGYVILLWLQVRELS